MDDATRTALQHATAARDWQAVRDLLDEHASAGQLPESLANLRRLAANLAVLSGRHPALADLLGGTPSSGCVRIDRAADGSPTLRLDTVGVPPGVLCPGGTPGGTRELARGFLKDGKAIRAGVALLGIGDGHALDELAREGPDTLGCQRRVYVVEPVPELFRCALMLHDWSAPLVPGGQSPLAGGRFEMIVGEDWETRFRACFREGTAYSFPRSSLSQSPHAPAMVRAVQKTADDLEERQQQLSDRVRAREDSWAPEEWRDRLRSAVNARRSGDRPPRVMLFTSRFSTVLEHSTRDFERGFAVLGFETDLIVEDTPWSRLNGPMILERVLAFEPDLFVQIDHHRHESPCWLPERVPFVCVIQDNLPNLTGPGVAERLGPTDFIAGPWVQTYITRHGYDAARSIEIPRLSPEPAREGVGGEGWSGEHIDFLYVSNHSATPERAVERVKESIQNLPRSVETMIDDTARRIIAVYERGGTLENRSDVEQIVEERAAWHGVSDAADGLVTHLTESLAVHLNNALYRREGLRWAADAAERLGLTLAIHGRGWEDHPEFSRYARGVIDYATELGPATRAARFCLMLEPYHVTSHQRSIDTWMWGGFVLARRRPRDARQHAFNAWMASLPEWAGTHEAALEAVGPDRADAFEASYAAQSEFDPMLRETDLVRLYRERAARGVGYLMAFPPGYEEISFADEAGFEACVGAFTANPSRRDELREEQTAWIRERFSYASGARRMIEGVLGSLAPAPTA